MLNNQYYTLSCPHCDNYWKMDKAFPKYCPYCGAMIGIKDSSTCIYGNKKILENTLIYKCNLFPGEPKSCEKCEYYDTKKDCSTCKYGCFNDIFQQYFCYNNDIECKEWDKWEART